MSKLPQRLKELRMSKGLSQQSLANYIGISKSSVNMYERGEREPGIETQEALADYFNVDLDYLVGRSDVPNRLAVPMSDESLKFALFGDTNVDDAVFDEVKRFAKFAQEQKRNEKK